MPNPFDQFDQADVAQFGGGPSGAQRPGNPFDQFDVGPDLPPERTRGQKIGTAVSSILENQYAGMQGTSPIVRDIEGKLNYVPLGEVVMSSDGTGLAARGGPEFDPKKHVVLTDPQTGKAMMFARDPKMEESKLTSLGRVLSPGMMVSAPTRLPGGQVAPAGQMAARVADMDAAGVTPRLATAADSPFLSTIRNILNRLPGSELVTRKAAQTNVGQMAGRADDIAAGFGVTDDPVKAGRAVQQGLTGKGGFVSRFQARSGELFDDVGRLIPQKQPFDMPQTTQALSGLTSKFPTNPELGKTLTPPTFQRWLDALKTSEGKLTWDEIRELRTHVGRHLDGAPIGDVPQGEWRQLYRALSEDLKGIADSVGPQARTAFDRFNRYYAGGRNRIDTTLKSVIGADTPEAAYAEILRSAQAKGASADLGQLQALRKSLNAEEWGEVASAVIRRMGQPTAGTAVPGEVAFSPASFVTNYSKLAPRAREELFSNKALRESLDQLARVASYHKGVEKLANSSNSGTQLIAGATGAAFFTEPFTTSLAVAGTTGGAALMEWAPMVRWLAGTAKFKGAEEFATHLNTLRPIIQTAPRELRPVIQAFADQLRERLRGDEKPQ